MRSNASHFGCDVLSYYTPCIRVVFNDSRYSICLFAVVQLSLNSLISSENLWNQSGEASFFLTNQKQTKLIVTQLARVFPRLVHVTRSLSAAHFSRAWRRLHVLTSRSDWLLASFSFAVIGQTNFFVCFTTVIGKLLQLHFKIPVMHPNLERPL